MTLAELRTATRNLSRQAESDSGTLFPAGDVLLDWFINSAAELVTLDLVDYLPSNFLTYEDISLVAGTSSYTLTAEWLQIYAMKRNVTDESAQIIPYYETTEELLAQVNGETAEFPVGFTLKGNSIIFMPKPSVSKTSYARCWIIAVESATIGSAGPTYIPRHAHRLIPLMACVLIGQMLESKATGYWEKMYQYWLGRVRDIVGQRIQQQPTFVKGSFTDKMYRDSRDLAFIDRVGYLDR